MRCKLIAATTAVVLGAASISAHAAPGDTNLSGKMFFDFTDINQKNSDTGKTDVTGSGFDIKRFYLGVDHQFDNIWSVNLTTDIQYSSAVGAEDVYVKKAYLQGKFSDAAVFRAGSADMPWIPFVESFYGFRYVENTLVDRLKFGTSADWGAHLGGTLGEGKMFNYAVSMVNGGGYKKPSRNKNVDFEGRVGFMPMDGLVVAVGGYSGKLGKETQNIDAQNTANRANVLVAYASKTVRLGTEYFEAKNYNNVLTPASDKASGYSAWGSVGVADGITAFARYDKSKLSDNMSPDDVYYNAGVEYQVTKGFKVAAVYKHQKGEFVSGTPAPVHVADLKTDEIGLWAEVAF